MLYEKPIDPEFIAKVEKALGDIPETDWNRVYFAVGVSDGLSPSIDYKRKKEKLSLGNAWIPSVKPVVELVRSYCPPLYPIEDMEKHIAYSKIHEFSSEKYDEFEKSPKPKHTCGFSGRIFCKNGRRTILQNQAVDCHII